VDLRLDLTPTFVEILPSVGGFLLAKIHLYLKLVSLLLHFLEFRGNTIAQLGHGSFSFIFWRELRVLTPKEAQASFGG
jgi:hypothetical protein